METLLRSLQLVSVGSWVPAVCLRYFMVHTIALVHASFDARLFTHDVLSTIQSLCAHAEVHFACYSSKLDLAIEKGDQKRYDAEAVQEILTMKLKRYRRS